MSQDVSQAAVLTRPATSGTWACLRTTAAAAAASVILSSLLGELGMTPVSQKGAAILVKGVAELSTQLPQRLWNERGWRCRQGNCRTRHTVAIKLPLLSSQRPLVPQRFSETPQESKHKATARTRRLRCGGSCGWQHSEPGRCTRIVKLHVARLRLFFSACSVLVSC